MKRYHSLIKTIILVVMIVPYSLVAQGMKSYVINKNGLKLYSQKDISKVSNVTIPYGDSLLVLIDSSIDNFIDKIMVDSIESNWYKVNYKGQIGYVPTAFVIPFRVPKKGIEDIGKYMQSISQMEMPQKTYTYKDIASDEFSITKKFFKNGMEAHYYEAYESVSSTYFLPSLSIEQGFALMRLFNEFELVNKCIKGLPKANTDFVCNDDQSVVAIGVESTHIGLSEMKISINTGGFFDYDLYYQNGILVICIANYI